MRLDHSVLRSMYNSFLLLLFISITAFKVYPLMVLPELFLSWAPCATCFPPIICLSSQNPLLTVILHEHQASLTAKRVCSKSLLQSLYRYTLWPPHLFHFPARSSPASFRLPHRTRACHSTSTLPIPPTLPNPKLNRLPLQPLSLRLHHPPPYMPRASSELVSHVHSAV